MTAHITHIPIRLRGIVALLVGVVVAALAIVPGTAHALPISINTPITKLHLPARADLRYGGHVDPFGRWIVQIPLGQTYVQAFQDARNSRPSTGATITKYEFRRDQSQPTYFVDNGAQGWRYRTYYAAQIGQEIDAAVRITDSNGGTDTRVVPFWLAYQPSASLQASQRFATPGETVVFDASGSRTRALEIERYEWSFDGGQTFTTSTGYHPTLAHKVGNSGYTCVIVRVTANDYGQDQTGSCVKVHDAPKASFKATPANPKPGTDVLLDASASSDDQGIVAYDWDLDGNGTYDRTTTTPTTTTAFPKAGKVDVHLRVTDGYGAKTVATRTIQVGGPAARQAHVLRLGLGAGTVKLRGGRVSLRVACPAAAQGGCDGTLALRLGGRKVGSAAFAIRRGHSATLGIKLSSAATKALAKAKSKRISTAVHAVATDDGGNPGVASATLRIRR